MKPSRYNLFIPQDDGDHVVYNTFSGALIILDQAAKDSIREGRIEDIDSETLRKLSDCNIVVEDNLDERKVFSYLYNKRVHSTETAMFTIVTTYACNLKCPYCYEGAGTLVDNAMDGGTLDRIFWFIRHVSEICNFRRLEIGLFGGEPLLNSSVCLRALDEIGSWTETNHIELTSWIFTNGTLLSDSILRSLARHGTGVRLTLDGPRWYHDRTRIFKDGRGTYDMIMDAISKLLSLGIDISIRIQVAKDNWMHFGELFDDLRERGFIDDKRMKIALSSIMPLTGVCSSYSPLCLQDDEIPEAYTKILEMASERDICLVEKPIPTTQRMFCGFMNDHVFAIDPFGDVYKCISLLGQKQHRIFSIDDQGIGKPTISLLGQKQHRIFSIDDQGIGKPTFEFFDFMSRDPSKMAKCRDCVYLPVCSGGCSLLAKKKFGTYHTGDCSLHKNTIERQIFDLVRTRVKDFRN